MLGALNHCPQLDRFHTSGVTSKADGELCLEKEGLHRLRKVRKEAQGNMSNWNTSATRERKFNKDKKAKLNKSCKSTFWAGKTRERLQRITAPRLLLIAEPCSSSACLTCALLLQNHSHQLILHPQSHQSVLILLSGGGFLLIFSI